MRLDHISPFRSKKVLRVVIETPKGSRNKYDYDPQTRAIVLAKTLPEGMVFPFNFGFIPQTEGEDGDPLDVLVLMDEPVAPGVVVPCRIVGLMRAVQTEGKKKRRNDRYLAVAETSLEFSAVEDARQLPAHLAEQIEQFFVTYNRLFGRRFSAEKVAGPAKALHAIAENHAAASAG
ncbi:MAG TPA: inorganic diphosphatase [Opitutaceae bacterium]|nr:inorganic diphosphatase [Opitutaceae bacterium]